VLWIVVDGGSW